MCCSIQKSKLTSSFFSKKLYAAIADNTFIAKFRTLPMYRVDQLSSFCSLSLMVLITDLFLKSSLSYIGINLFFHLTSYTCTKLIPSLNNAPNSPLEMYSLSVNNFPNTLSISLLKTFSFL